MLVSMSAFAQEQEQQAAKVDSKATSETVDQLSMANQLVKYGYQTKSALPLIQAVQIYKKLNVTDEAREKTTEGARTGPACFLQKASPRSTSVSVSGRGMSTSRHTSKVSP